MAISDWLAKIFTPNNTGTIAPESTVASTIPPQESNYYIDNQTAVNNLPNMTEEETSEVIDFLNNEMDAQFDYEQYVIDQLQEELDIAKEELQEQEDEDGFINDLFNGLKELTTLGVSKSEVKDAIKKQEETINQLIEAKRTGNFESVYEQITGNKYDEQKLIECHNTETILEAMESDLTTILNSNESDEVKQEYINQYLLTFQNETGISYEDLTNQYKELSEQYLASSNELTNILNKYTQSQDGFIDKAANVAQIGGIGLMVVGGIACFIPGGQVIGAGMMKAGQMLSLGGMFGDNVLDVANNLTNQKSFNEEKDEYAAILKETAIEGVSYLSGRLIGSGLNGLKLGSSSATGALGELLNKGTNGINDYVTSKFGSKILGQVAETTLDAALSLGADYVIAQGDSLITNGEFLDNSEYWSAERFLGEGKNQLLGILTGLAGTKIPDAQVNTKLDAFIANTMKLNIAGVKAETNASDVKTEMPDVKVEAPDVEVEAADVEVEAPRMSFNPETGELTPIKPQGEVETVTLDHEVRGDNVGVKLDTDFSSVDYKNLTPEQRAKIDECAIDLATTYNKEISGIEAMFKGLFGSENTISTRGKSPKSTLEKLIANQQKGKLSEITTAEAEKLIGDGYGIRLQMPSLTKAQTDSIVQECLAGTGKTQADFQKLIDEGNYTALLADDDFRTTFESLKEARSQGVVDSLVDAIKTKQIVPANGKDDYFNNYGSEITSYLTNAQLLQIDRAYYTTYGIHLSFVNKTPVEIPNDDLEMYPELAKITTNQEKAQKPSGYTDTQFNIVSNHTDSKNLLADMELQLRGTEVHKIAEVEHIPYDVRQGKITATNPKYSQYYSLLKGMSPESYEKYNEYLNASYTWAILKELNLTTDAQKPKLEVELTYGDVEYLQEVGIDTSYANKTLTPEEMKKITLEGLAKYKVN